MMDFMTINYAFLHGLTVEIYDEDGLAGRGKVLLHTRDTVKLDDGMYYYYKDMFILRLTDSQ